MNIYNNNNNNNNNNNVKIQSVFTSKQALKIHANIPCGGTSLWPS